MSAAADRPADHTSPVPAATTPAASDESTVLFREHLFPGPTVWVVAVAIGAALGLILVPLNLTVAIVFSSVCILALLVLVHQYSPVLEVANGRFRLGRAQIGVELLGDPTPLQGEDWARTIGQGFEPLAHHCIRGWTRSGLRVEVLDPEDPITAWVASTRRPEDLALALRTAKQLKAREGR